MQEIENVMKSHSISVDRRHVMLLADIMTLTVRLTAQVVQTFK